MVTVVALAANLIVVGVMTVIIVAQSRPIPPETTGACDQSQFDATCAHERAAEPEERASLRAVEHVTLDRSTQPHRLQINVLDVNAPIVPVGKTRQNGLEIPEDIDLVGWYRYGATPAWGVGSTVLVGHRDGVLEGHGALYDLAALAPGDIVQVTDLAKRETDFEVIARAVISKQEFADRSAELFSTTGPARLRLISCGGYYDAEQGGYQSNVVVTAKPLPS